MMDFENKNSGTELEDIPAIQSLDQFLTAAGRSRTTGYRWRQLGYLKAITICGRPYVTRDAVQEFLKRAASGEFAQEPAGAALKSAETRAAKGKDLA